jgi:uncharacterized membrane protein
MVHNSVAHPFLGRAKSRRCQRQRTLRPSFEGLEDRLMLDGAASNQLPAAIVIGRTLAAPATAETATPSPSYFIGEVQNNQVTITITVYNEQANTEKGVLVTDTLAPGVSLVSSDVTLDGTTTAQPPDQNGQNLAWSLAPIQGYDRESVALTVNLPAVLDSQPAALPLDTGAHAYAMIDAGAVSASTPAATLQAGNVSDPSLLASTVDADTNDPFIQEEAAKLYYDPTQIFNFLHTQIGYDSYLGSVRGARGTLWSNAGNALDVASLGVALMRASGIPAQYLSGTLSQSQAHQLILSMFPASYQTVGYISAGTQVSNPANDPQLLAETASHYWFRFETGSGMTDADPLVPGASIGQKFATPTSKFNTIPQSLEETTEVELVAEIYSQASALFEQSGLQDTTVLHQTFDDDYLVGRPLSIGNLVSTTSAEFIFTATTNTYSPYLDVGDEAYPSSHDEVIEGTPYQEVLSDFPLASHILTGLFLNATPSGPQGQSQTYSRALVDRIGYAVRKGLVQPSISVDPTAPPILSDFNIFTLNVLPGLTVLPSRTSIPTAASDDSVALTNDQNANTADNRSVFSDLTRSVVDLTRLVSAEFLAGSDFQTAQTADASEVIAYFARPRLVLVSTPPQLVNGSISQSLSVSIDLRNDAIHVIAFPGQNTDSVLAFNISRGVLEGAWEAGVLQGGSSIQQNQARTISTVSVFEAAMAAGMQFGSIGPGNVSRLSSLDISENAKSQINTAIEEGNIVLLPLGAVTVGGISTSAWYQLDPTSGETIAVTEDGGHQALSDFGAAYLASQISSETKTIGEARLAGSVLGLMVINFATTKLIDRNEIGGASERELVAAVIDFAKKEANSLPPLYQNNPLALSAFNSSFRPLVIDAVKIIIDYFRGAKGSNDPPIAPLLMNWRVPPPQNNTVEEQVAPTTAAGTVQCFERASGLALSNEVEASWSAETFSSFSATALHASSATVISSNGTTVGSGVVSQTADNAFPVMIFGHAAVVVRGNGSLSFYGHTESTLSVSGDWHNYSAMVTGDASITLTVRDGALTLNGQALPAGTYTVTTNSATLSGSGTMCSPNFAGSGSITATNGTLNLGPGSGTLSAGGKPLDPSDETTLDGYTGTINISANGDGTDSVWLNGNAGKVLQVAVSPPPQPSNTTGGGGFVTDQNAPITFATNVETSLADTYNITVNAPQGWTVTVGSQGKLTATPAPGLQSGTYPIQVIAQSQTDPNLEAQTTVDVTIKPTQPGINFTVAPDTLFTVPYNGAQLPTAFRASIQNLGPTADAYNLTFSNIPSGFTLLNSGTSVTVPAGQTGILGVYLQPDAGQPIPQPGTQLSFTVTATSVTDLSITQTQTETFTVPDIDAVSLASSPSSMTIPPGVTVTTTLTLKNDGNVSETVSLATAAPTGLTAGSLAPITLAIGATQTETLTLTPTAATPLNNTFDVTITATYGPSGSPANQTVDIPVNVAIPGASAIANASVAAGQLGNSNLADRLSDLGTALTNLVENPASAVYQSEAQASLAAVIGLLGADPFLSAVIPALRADATNLAQATTSSAVEAAASTLGGDLDTVGTTLSDETAHGFKLSLLSNTAVALPDSPAYYALLLQNTGNQATTYDLSVSGLPSSASAAFLQDGQQIESVTLQPGQATNGGPDAITLELTESSGTLLPTGFTLTVAAEGSADIVQSVSGTLTVRSSFIAVTAVDTNPPAASAGTPVDVTAEVLNVVNRQQQAEAYFTVTAPGGNVVFTSMPVSLILTVQSSFTTADLGQFDTGGLADGGYTINVSVTDGSGNNIPGGTGQGVVLIGTPGTATLSVSPSKLPAGNGIVTNTLSVSSTPFSATVQVPNNTGVAIVPGSFNVAPTQIIEGTDFDTLIWTGVTQSPLTWESKVTNIQAGDSVQTTLGASVTFTNSATSGTGGSLLTSGQIPYPNPGSVPPPAYFVGAGGDVIAYFDGRGTAVYNSDIAMLVNGVMSPAGFVFPNHSTQFGTSVDLGFAPLGATISFELQVFGLNPVALVDAPNPHYVGTPIYDLYSDPTLNSIDNTNHIYATAFTAADSANANGVIPPGTYVAFEDELKGFSDLNYNDHDFVFSNLVASAVPPFTVALPPTSVSGAQILALSPATQTVAPGSAADYTVTVMNPTGSAETYNLSVQGISPSWVRFASQVTVAANSSGQLTLTLTSDAFAALADYGFTVTANDANGATAAVSGDLVLEGQSVEQADPNSHGVVAVLTPPQAIAGQGTSAQYTVQLTNTGSADDSFSLAAAGLPRGVTASFVETTMGVPPGASNFRDVPLVLKVAEGTKPGTYLFSVSAASKSDPTVTSTAAGTLTVTAFGVKVTLNPPSGAPGSSFQATVTNTGTTADTFNLALAGPAALISSLGMKQVTLSPGASQIVRISTSAVNFAVQRNLRMIATATSATNPAIQGAASADLTISSTKGMTAEFSPASRALSTPGKTTFLLLVHNTGNSEDFYSATIIGTKGPITATLVGLDGSPTNSISEFILPGLSTGAILLQADLTAAGEGTVTVRVTSLTSVEMAAPVATAIVKSMPPQSNDGPRIKGVSRYGYHMMPTTVLITFDQPLDPSTAENVNSYLITDPNGRRIRISRAVYNPANLTVTLYPNDRISIHRPYSLTVKGEGPNAVRGTDGQLLDGKDSGKPGSNFRLVLTWRQLVLENASRAFRARFHILPRTKHSPDPAGPQRLRVEWPHAVQKSATQIAKRSAAILRRTEMVKHTQASAT